MKTTVPRNLILVTACVIFALTAGCASNESTLKAVQPDDVKSLAGKWKGWIHGTSWSSMEVIVRSDGTYFSAFGASTSRGVVKVSGDSNIIFEVDAQQSISTVATGTLRERQGRLLIVGDGRDHQFGPFTFEVVRQ